MWKIIWTAKAEENYFYTLKYWIEHNKSTAYSEKIIDETENVELSILENPYFLSRYHRSLNLYQKLFFKQKFSIFYEINESDKKIVIKHFRNNKQKPFIE
jgi:plasmid stabilization system protein ParE